MHRSTFIAALGASASLIAGSLVLAAPAEAATRCADSPAVAHAKVEERALLAHLRSSYSDERRSAKDQLAIDHDVVGADRADSSTTAGRLARDEADVKRDRADVKALTKGVTWISGDRAYFARCGQSVLLKGARRAAKHIDRTIVAVDRASLVAVKGQLAYDEEQLKAAEAGDDPSGENQARADIDADGSSIDALHADIARLEKLISKL